MLARAPQLGRVKRRLAADIGQREALRWHRRLLAHSLAALCSATQPPVHLWVTARHPFWRPWETLDHISLMVQGGGDLGGRMRRAFEHALGGFDAAVMVGSDCPAMDRHYVERAFAQLADADAVFGPASDGGYVLVGMRRLLPELFCGIAWGGASVLADSLAALRRTGHSHRLLETLGDVDRRGDLQDAGLHLADAKIC